ncbi:MAG: GntR family transcriptional regulator [Clostridia bacterium]|nr:GntR family transcriptional regulator [Clostridia bacterium]
MNFTFNIDNKIDKSSVIPAYYQLAKILEHNIRLGRYKKGECLPPENELSEIYGISRMTTRKAIAELVKKKMVLPQKGKGTIVCEPNKEIVFELDDFFEDMKKKGLNPSSKLIEARILRADEKLAHKLQIPIKTKYIFFRSILFAEDEPLVYDTKYIVYSKQKPILEELNEPSLQKLVVAHSQYIPGKSLRTLKAINLTDEESLLLNVKPNTAAFLLEQIIYDVNNNPIGLGKSLYRGDRYQLSNKGEVWY